MDDDVHVWACQLILAKKRRKVLFRGSILLFVTNSLPHGKGLGMAVSSVWAWQCQWQWRLPGSPGVTWPAWCRPGLGESKFSFESDDEAGTGRRSNQRAVAAGHPTTPVTRAQALASKPFFLLVWQFACLFVCVCVFVPLHLLAVYPRKRPRWGWVCVLPCSWPCHHQQEKKMKKKLWKTIITLFV